MVDIGPLKTKAKFAQHSIDERVQVLVAVKIRVEVCVVIPRRLDTDAASIFRVKIS
jgi:hypothetical protein